MWEYGMVEWQGKGYTWDARVVRDGFDRLYIGLSGGLMLYLYGCEWCRNKWSHGKEPPQELLDMIVSRFPVREDT